jgi:hypothetical protein
MATNGGDREAQAKVFPKMLAAASAGHTRGCSAGVSRQW